MAEGVVERLEQDTKDAMRARDKLRLGALRMARAALKNAQIEARGELSEDAAVRALRGVAKQHRESIAQFRAGGREDLAEREEAELAVVEAYLPAQLDAAAVEALVAAVIADEGAEGPKDLGRVMRSAMQRAGGPGCGGEPPGGGGIVLMVAPPTGAGRSLSPRFRRLARRRAAWRTSSPARGPWVRPRPRRR